MASKGVNLDCINSNLDNCISIVKLYLDSNRSLGQMNNAQSLGFEGDRMREPRPSCSPTDMIDVNSAGAGLG